MESPYHQQIIKKWYEDDAKYKLRLTYDLNAESVVFDLGAFKGEWALDIFNKYNCRVYAFEPITEFYKEIKSKSNLTKIIAFDVAMGGSTREDEINLGEDGSSLYEPGKGTCKIRVVAIDEFIKAHDVTKIDLMKLNIEGAEYEVFEKLIEQDMISMCGDFQIQFHPTVENFSERRKAIRDKLYETHKLTYNYEYVWENWTKR